MATYLCNAFSLQMLEGENTNIQVRRMETAPTLTSDIRCCIGHADTAAVIGGMIGRPLKANRENVTLQPGDTLYVAQLMGGRLPEGATTLPKGFEIAWFEVTLQPPHQISFLVGLNSILTLTQEENKLPTAILRHQVCRRGRFLPETEEEISLEQAAKMVLDIAEQMKVCQANTAASLPSFEGVTIDGLTIRNGTLVDEYGNYLCPVPKVSSVEELTEFVRNLEAPE